MFKSEPILESLVEVIRSSEHTWFFPGHLQVPAELESSALNDLGMARWSAVILPTEPAALSTLYESVPGPLPRLFEQMLLSYRWFRVGIPGVELHGNPPGPGLDGFKEEILRDANLFPVLFSHRLVEFGKAAGGHYDPICFDLNRRRSGDSPIVRVDHEAILMNRRVRVMSEVAPGFRAFAEKAVAEAT
jgi:hypothetical protein